MSNYRFWTVNEEAHFGVLVSSQDGCYKIDVGAKTMKRITRAQGTGWWVSTVHLFDEDDGTPVFETMAFPVETMEFPEDSSNCLLSERYKSDENARVGHDAIVLRMISEGPALIDKWRSKQQVLDGQ